MAKFNILDNPYTLQFSFIPPQFIERTMATNEIVNNFIMKTPTYRGIFITGVRGSGKTVILGDIRNRINAIDEWITIDLNPESNLLDSLARQLYLLPEIKAIFIKAKLDFSVLGIGVQIENANLVASNEEDALKMMLEALKKSGKKLLVTIDEVTYGNDVARFSHALSSYAGANYDIYVLMTGLLENIKKIKNEKSLTFLYRAKLKELDELNITAICADYEKVLNLSREKAMELAKYTRGYSLAFQTIGYYTWKALCTSENENDVNWEDVYQQVDITLSELAYEKIWDELSELDKKVIIAMNDLLRDSDSNSVKIDEIREALNMTSNTFTTYRKRLIESGIVGAKQYGHLSFRLPRFENFVEMRFE